ncbi:MAG: protealysin inhibitor emfourin [Ktedonobacteraceae bacterium]
MWIQFKMEGGLAYFLGLSKPTMIESDELPKQEADELKRLIDAAHFFDLPAEIVSPPRGAADYRQYTITIEDDRKQHTVRLTDPIADPNLQALLTYLKTRRSASG